MINNLPTTPILLQDLGYMYPKETSKQKRRFGIYLCNCGIEFKVQTQDIRSGKTLSCGCHRKQIHTIHGLNKHVLYEVWSSMLRRTSNPKHTAFKHYGARGIKVCERWLSISNFIEDMYSTYREGLSIDRIDNEGDYTIDNCRWTTDIIQAQNTRKIRSTNRSGYRGVYFHKGAKKFRTSISINSKRIHLGYFETSLEAAIAYDSYVIANNLEHTINGVVNQKDIHARN